MNRDTPIPSAPACPPSDTARPAAPDAHVALSKLLSKILRHEPELVEIRLDAAGWIEIDTLVLAIERAAQRPALARRLRDVPAVSAALILAVAASSEKQRFTISRDQRFIRAAQGHSIDVELGYAAAEAPAVLYHGTASHAWPAIAREGLKAGMRFT
ncbi:MAG: RNA 2'-phosphotransferase [Burkholderia plantarii]|nr:MAG: RNA 2'-phosphotransferase [Burkholderia plantarii]